MMEIAVMKLDKFDREILRVLQQDATVSMADFKSTSRTFSHTVLAPRKNGWKPTVSFLGKVTLLKQ